MSYGHAVVRDRGATSEEGQGCVAFLTRLTEENVILLGMMADGSDECMLLARFMDSDMFEIGAVRFELQQFHNRINYLFLNKACFLQTGYTKMVLDV